jgi:3-deoxy-D-arabino-heptulosonate 7-phosphate (DAHP) synthase
MLIYPENCGMMLVESEQESGRYETIMIESKVREGVFHKVIKDLKSGKSVSCSCKCWSKGHKPCVGMRTVGYE